MSFSVSLPWLGDATSPDSTEVDVHTFETAHDRKDVLAVTMSVRELIAHQYVRRLTHPDISSIKLNLYKNYEVEAVANALTTLSQFGDPRFPECLMVGDSYLMTHLGRTSTRLDDEAEQAWFLQVMDGLVEEVARAAGDVFDEAHRPYIIADMPDGSVRDFEIAVRNIERMQAHGADVIKVEVAQNEMLEIIERLTARGVCVIAHIGYAPQKNASRAYGTSYAEALEVFALARACRDSGACALVLERVSQIVNERLCLPHRNGLPVYSIFSGRVKYGGQSLNVWDAVFQPPFKAKFFPPTATLQTSCYPASYTSEVISSHFAALLELALSNQFPLPVPSRLDPNEVEMLSTADLW